MPIICLLPPGGLHNCLNDNRPALRVRPDFLLPISVQSNIVRRMPSIPTIMRAATIERFGPPTVLKIRELPIPKISPTEILVKVHTAGVGSWDPDIRGGWWPEGKPRFPLILGTDGSGIVVAVGSR